MSITIKNLTLLLFVVFAFAACVPLSINPPTPENPTLLVLPAEIVRDAQSAHFGFAYAYEIVSDDKSVPPYKALFKLPVKNGMVIVDSLPPGRYTVARLLTIPVGTGDRTYNTASQPVNYRFRLENGKVTIFSYSLYVRTFNPTPGHVWETTYSSGVRRTTSQQVNDILEKLGGLPNFSDWEVFGNKGTGTTSSRISGQQKKYAVPGNLQGNWIGTWRPITAGDYADCIEGRLSFDINGSRLSGEGTDSAGDFYRIAASLVGDGLIRGKISLNRMLVAKVSGRLYDDGTILGSFEYDNGCMAEWKARKN